MVSTALLLEIFSDLEIHAKNKRRKKSVMLGSLRMGLKRLRNSTSGSKSVLHTTALVLTTDLQQMFKYLI